MKWISRRPSGHILQRVGPAAQARSLPVALLVTALVAPALVAPGAGPFGSASLAAQQFEVHPATQDPAVLVTLETLAQWEEELSNWGRWGSDDQRGTFNLITAQKTREAALLVRDGITVTLQHFVTGE